MWVAISNPDNTAAFAPISSLTPDIIHDDDKLKNWISLYGKELVEKIEDKSETRVLFFVITKTPANKPFLILEEELPYSHNPFNIFLSREFQLLLSFKKKYMVFFDYYDLITKTEFKIDLIENTTERFFEDFHSFVTNTIVDKTLCSYENEEFAVGKINDLFKKKEQRYGIVQVRNSIEKPEYILLENLPKGKKLTGEIVWKQLKIVN